MQVWEALVKVSMEAYLRRSGGLEQVPPHPARHLREGALDEAPSRIFAQPLAVDCFA